MARAKGTLKAVKSAAQKSGRGAALRRPSVAKGTSSGKRGITVARATKKGPKITELTYGRSGKTRTSAKAYSGGPSGVQRAKATRYTVTPKNAGIAGGGAVAAGGGAAATRKRRGRRK